MFIKLMSAPVHTIVAFIMLPLVMAACEAAEPPLHLRIEGGDARKGRELISSYGCGTCHTIEGVSGAIGVVGPPIVDFAQRTVLAGAYPNVPRFLVPWLMDPPALKSRTGMPNLGLTAKEARHIATYLYTLGADDVVPYEMRPTEAQYPWIGEVKAHRRDEARRLSETARAGPGTARIPIEKAIELLPGMSRQDASDFSPPGPNDEAQR